MLGKDLNKEGWIKIDPSELENEFNADEIENLVRIAYRDNVKYRGLAKINKNLLDRYNNLTYTKTLSHISSVCILRNVKMMARVGDFDKDFFIIEADNEPKILLNISEGEDESYAINREIGLTQYSKIENLYNYNSNNYQYDITLNEIDNVTLYKKAKLINTFSNIEVASSNIVQIEDIKGTKMFIDLVNNKIYTSMYNYKLDKKDNAVGKLIFKNGVPIKK